MKYNQLGRTGLFVSEICLGTMTFGGDSDAGIWKMIGALDQGEVDGIVGQALAAGVNFIDTADVYSFGQSETLLGQSLKNLGVARKDVVLATKVFGEMGPGPNDKARRAATSWIRCRAAWIACRPTISTSTRSTATTRSPPSRRPCAPWTT
uniref:Aldo/keto reductase n=1 Tax=Phenylobacterium glaciei TaxID=2803784 RepID=A0A974S8K9_9CAUL|nr:aldo/keto reductase [Phenylobacterium glaciei]